MAEETTVGSIKYDLDLDDANFSAKAAGASSKLEGLSGAFQKAEAGSKVFALGLLAAGAVAVGFGVESVKAYEKNQDAVAGLTAGLKNTYQATNTAGYYTSIHTGATKENTKEIKAQIAHLDLQKQVLDKGSSSYKANVKSIDDQIIALKKQELATGVSTTTTGKWIAGVHTAATDTSKFVEELEKQAEALQQVTKFSHTQILSADAMLTTFKLSEPAIKKLNPSLLDMAEGLRDVNGQTIGLDEGAKLLGKAMGNAEGGIEGLSSALRRNGVIMTDAQKEVFKTGTESQRTNTMVEILSANFGGRSAAAAKTFSGQMTILRNNFDDFQELIGKAIAARIAPLIKGFTEWAKSMGGPQGILDKFNKDILPKLQQNLPIIIGLIFGGLAPALYAAAGGMVALFAPLIPFIAAGVLLGIIAKALIEHFGGWHAMMQRIQPVLKFIGEIFKQDILPQLKELWKQLSTQLIPQLKELWNVLEPVLVPVLKVVAAIFGIMLLEAIMIFIGGLRLLVFIISDMVKNITHYVKQVFAIFKWLFDELVGHSLIPDLITGIAEWFTKLPGLVGSALKGLYSAITKPFSEAFDKVKNLASDMLNHVKDALDFTKRHSPSVIDIVQHGVNLVNKEFLNIGSMTIPSVSSHLLAANGGVGTNSGQNITVNVGKIGSNLDIESVAREIGFRIATQPR